jgi:Na+-transporting NADH:ubiquinone oxidoreductase subunit NqrE
MAPDLEQNPDFNIRKGLNLSFLEFQIAIVVITPLCQIFLNILLGNLADIYNRKKLIL